MAANIKSIMNQNLTMQKLLMQIQGQEGHPILPYVPQGQYQQEDDVQSQRAMSSKPSKETSPLEREVGVDISSNYASGQPTEAPFNVEDNFLPQFKLEHKPRRSSSMFARISLVEPRYRQPQQPPACQNRTQLSFPTLRQPEERQEHALHVAHVANRYQRREKATENQESSSNHPPENQANNNDDSDGLQRLFNQDDDDENLPFSQELRRAPCRATI